MTMHTLQTYFATKVASYNDYLIQNGTDQNYVQYWYMMWNDSRGAEG